MGLVYCESVGKLNIAAMRRSGFDVDSSVLELDCERPIETDAANDSHRAVHDAEVVVDPGLNALVVD